MSQNVLFLLLHVALVPLFVESAVEFCTTYSTVKVRQNDTCTNLGTKHLALSTINVVAMRGEYEHVQILLRNTNKKTWATAKLSFILRDEVGNSFPGTVDFLQVGYVNCTKTPRYSPSGGGWRPDPILPLGVGNSVNLEPQYLQPIWVRIGIPQTAPSGTYSGAVNINFGESSDHSTTRVSTPFLASIHMRVDVAKFVVPSLMNATFGYAYSFVEDALSPFYPVTKQLKQRWYTYLANRRTYADSLYHREPRPLEDYKMLAAEGAQWFNLRFVSHKDDPQTVITSIEPILKQLTQLGLQDRAYLYGFDENPPGEQPAIRKIYGAIKKKFPSLRLVATLNWKEVPTDLPVDVLVKQYEYYNATQAKIWKAAGKKIYLYHCIEPSGSTFLNTFIERPGIQARLLYWLGAMDQADGWLYYAMDLWKPKPPAKHTVIERLNGTARTNFAPANYIWLPRTDIWANGDGQFLYPGPSGEPVGSVRLDIMSDGLEDVELWNSLPRAQALPLLKQLVRGPTDFTSDPCLMEKVRRQALGYYLACPQK